MSRSPNDIVKVSRCIFSFGAGLAGYGTDDRLLIVVPAKGAKSAHAWARQNITKADTERARAHYLNPRPGDMFPASREQ